MKRIKLNGKVLILALGGALLPWHITGCVSPQSDAPAEDFAGSRADIRILEEDMARIEGDIETLNMRLDQMSKNLDRSQSSAAHTGSAQSAALERRTMDLQERIDRLEAARRNDREEIINSITARVTKIVAGQGPRQKPSRPTGGSQTGYEHTVGSGETLSAIASAYSVKMKTIIDANNLSDPNNLRVGQTLFIPE